ncbi:MAG TPA: hypothetical protein PJ990_11120, partial [Saprospiraceae bacterium]|nr:hypothetical protein [Saprospiraceae bacterium]
CIDVVETIIPNPTDANCGAVTPVFVTGCIIDATPETIITTCGADKLPTVWFKVIVDAEAVQLQTTVTTSGTWQPVWSIYYGDCTAPILLDGGGPGKPSNPCSNSDGNEFIHSVGVVEDIETYWIAVSGMVEIDDDPNFTLGVTTLAGCVSCLGDAGCGPEAEWEVKERSSDRPLDDPKFCPGEEVTICVNFAYDASETGSNWLHGIIPDFGPGWDMVNFDGGNITSNIGIPTWISKENTSCTPTIQEQMPFLCTYTDPLTGRLVLCNTGCQACPCTGPLLLGSGLPSGWFWNTPGGVGCESDCRPSTNYGIGSQAVDINFCVDLKVRELNNAEDCIRNRSLRFNFQTTSDGVTGCWNDPIAECKLDYAQIGPNWEIDCATIPNVIGQNLEVCSNEPLNLEIFTEDGSGLDIEVISQNNPFVSGQKNYIITGGSGIINDTLINNTDNDQFVFYFVKALDPSIECGNTINTFEVRVHPSIRFENNDIVACNDTIIMTTINPTVSGGTGDLSYVWSTGDTTQNIIVTTDSTVIYSVTITDEIGCNTIEKPSIFIFNNGESIANLSFSPPSCNQHTVDIGIESIINNSSSNVSYRLLDCAGNQVMNDTLPYIAINAEGVFLDVDYITNNCFQLEATLSNCVTLSDSIIISCISSTLDNTIKQVTLI